MSFCEPPVVVNEVIVPTGADFHFILETLNRQVLVDIYQNESGPQVSLEVTDQDFGFIMSCSGPLFGELTCFSGEL